MQDFLSTSAQFVSQIVLIVSFFPIWASAETPAVGNAPTPAIKKGFNTEIYEREDTVKFTDNVRLTREMAGEFQVFFKNRNGVYRLSEASSSQALFVKAQKQGFKVNVTVDPESRMILKAEEKP